MKKIVSFFFLLLGLTYGLFFQSCSDDDGFSIGDIAVDWSTVHAKSAHTYSLTGDVWGTMWPSASAVTYTPVDGERVVAIFNPLYKDYEGYDYAIKMEGIQRILTKQVEELTAQNDEEYGDDPVNITKGDIWISGGYLNVIFKQNMPSKLKHRVSLVRDTTEPLVDEDGYVNLEYRYNTYDDVTGRWGNGAVSFRLSSLDLTSVVKGLKVKINSAVNGEVVLTFTFDEDNSVAPAGLSALNYAEVELQ